MNPQPGLPLRDVHPGALPSWWPPAPGWWLLLALALLLLVAVGLWWRHRQQRIRAWMTQFDAALAQAETPVDEIAAMSELLRRAARRVDPASDHLQGEEWLRLLDRGMRTPAFEHGPGALLADGGYRRSADPQAVAALREVARRRYRSWMPRR